MAETTTNPNQAESSVSEKQTQDLISLESLSEQKTAIQKYLPSPSGALRQGEILSNLKQFKLNLESLRSGKPLAEPIIHPFAIVVTQDCDSEQDFKKRQASDLISDKIIPSILFCEVVVAEQLRNRDKDNKVKEINSTVWGQVKINKNERYHFLESVPAELNVLGEGLPELTLDFKRYFTIPTEEVYYRLEIKEAQRCCRLVSPYLEHLTSRFNYFQYRIALPEDHTSE